MRFRIAVGARVYTSVCTFCYLPHDQLDGVGTPTALRAAAEALVNLAHPLSLSGLGKCRTNLLITKHVARADDHDIVLTQISRHGRNEGEQHKATAPCCYESNETPLGTCERVVLGVFWRS